jgi:YD repeat-containing protein
MEPRYLSYNAHGVITASLDPNCTTVQYNYDALDRLVGKLITPGPGVGTDTTQESFHYDGLSRIVRADNNQSSVVRQYDSESNITQDTLNGMVTSCSHDGVGNNVTIMYPGGRSITTTYDALRRRSTVSDQGGLIAAYSYVGTDRVERRDYGNGTRAAYEYDGVLPNPSGALWSRKLTRTLHQVIVGGNHR